MVVSTLFIGDPHFQISNLEDVEKCSELIYIEAIDKQPDIIIVAGDLLHTHERLHTLVMNKAIDFVKQLITIAPTFILVGNHDYISNTEFLTSNHWMNSMKGWDNLTIVDKVEHITIDDCNFIFVPYVFPGRFNEALNTLENLSLSTCNCIFAHQEFKGCKMGAIVSEIGDVWSADLPLVVTGHIHQRQWVGNNIYYPGTPLQHSFGESPDKSISYLTFTTDTYNIEEIFLDIPTKKIVYLNADELSDDIDVTKYENIDGKTKITIKGTNEEFKALKKSKLYKRMTEQQGVTVSFKANPTLQLDNELLITNDTDISFSKILKDNVVRERDPILTKMYQLIVHDNDIDASDIFYM